MAAKKVGELVKEARTAAKLTQEKLAQAVGGNLTAADISKCERGEADLSAAQLKKIAVACGVTQASLVNAPKNLSAAAAKTASAKKNPAKTAAAKTGTTQSTSAKTSAKATAAKTAAKKTEAKKTEAKKTAAKTPANANTSMKVTAAEKKLIEAYRESTSDRKKAALKLLNGEYGDAVDKLLSVTNGTASSSSSSSSGGGDLLGDMLGGVLGNLFGGK